MLLEAGPGSCFLWLNELHIFCGEKSYSPLHGLFQGRNEFRSLRLSGCRTKYRYLVFWGVVLKRWSFAVIHKLWWKHCHFKQHWVSDLRADWIPQIFLRHVKSMLARLSYSGDAAWEEQSLRVLKYVRCSVLTRDVSLGISRYRFKPRGEW